MIGAKVRKGWRATPVSDDVRHQPVAQPAVVATTRPVLRCQKACRAFRRLSESIERAWCTQSGGGINRSSVDATRASVQDLARSSPVEWGGGSGSVPHGPKAVHLHPARIPENSVLPRAESATGCIFRQPGTGLAP